MKVFFVSLLLVMMSAMALMTARFWGLSQQFQEFRTGFDSPGTYDAIPWEQSELLIKRADLILWVGIYQAENQDILAHPWQERAVNIKELPSKQDATHPPLSDLLARFPNSRFILQLNDNRSDIHFRVQNVIDQAKATDRVLMQSDYNILLEALKEKAPTQLYGSSQADLMRLRTFASGYILPAVPFKGDALIGTLMLKNVPVIDAEIVAEMKRRKKRIILGPISTTADLEKAQQLRPSGLFLTNAALINSNFLAAQ